MTILHELPSIPFRTIATNVYTHKSKMKIPRHWISGVDTAKILKPRKFTANLWNVAEAEDPAGNKSTTVQVSGYMLFSATN